MKTKTQKKTERRKIKKTVNRSEYPWIQSEEVPDVYGGWDLRKRKVLRLE